MNFSDCPGMCQKWRKGLCRRCGSELTGRRTTWCSDECGSWWFNNHWFNYAKGGVADRRKVEGSWRWTCELCETVVVSYEIDHIERARGRHNVASCVHHQENLRLLCKPCHRAVTAAQRREDAERARVAMMAVSVTTQAAFDLGDAR